MLLGSGYGKGQVNLRPPRIPLLPLHHLLVVLDLSFKHATPGLGICQSGSERKKLER